MWIGFGASIVFFLKKAKNLTIIEKTRVNSEGSNFYVLDPTFVARSTDPFVF